MTHSLSKILLVLSLLNVIQLRQAWAQFSGTSATGKLPGEQHIIPPAPTTTSLGRYGNLPVDLNAGVATVSVPLGEVQCRSLTLPLALAYRTTGIRVEEVASWVGLGWSLNVGGMVTRIVRGQPDETDNSGYFASYQRWRTIDSAARANPTSATLAAKKQVDLAVINGSIDIEPDTYSVSIAGQSATFTLDVHRRVHMNPFREWKIVGGPEATWEIVLPNGVRYRFEAVETTQVALNPAVSSTWHLSSIVSANEKDSILLDYSTVGAATQAVAVNRVFRAKLPHLPYSADPVSSAYPAEDPPFTDGNVATAVNYSTLVLRQIRAATTLVNFETTFNRPDLIAGVDPPGAKLMAVVFTDTRQPTSIRRFSFSYHHTGDRLFLDAVQKLGQPPYRFTYNTALALPARTSYAQDHWGYYNGQQNCSLIPAPPASVATLRINNPLACANRETNPSVMQAGVLTSIKYPTGGSTSFEYEANSVVTPATATDSVITIFAAATGLRGTAPSQLDALSQTIYDVVFPDNCCIGAPSLQAYVFTLPAGASQVSFRKGYRPGTNTTYDTRCELWKLNDSQPDPAAFLTGTQLYPATSAGGGLVVAPTTLLAGTYLAFAATTVDLQDYAYLEITLHVAPKLALHTRPIGGLRLRRMTDYGQIGDSIISLYNYTRYDSTYARWVGSGQLFFEPQYIRFTPSGGAVVAAADASTMGYAQEGYHIGYQQVNVVRQGAASGMTTTHFLNRAETNHRNLITSLEEYDATKRLIKQVRTEYITDVSEIIPFHNVIFDRYLVSPCGQAGCSQFYTISGEVYETLLTPKVYVEDPLEVVSTERTFPTAHVGNNLLAGQESSIRYTYLRLPSGHHRMAPTIVRKMLASTEQLITRITYPLDYDVRIVGDIPTQGIADLLSHHVFTTPIETQQWRQRGRDSVLISGQLTHYQQLKPLQTWNLMVQSPVPPTGFKSSTIQNGRFNQDSRYYRGDHFDAYNQWGNLQEQHYQSAYTSYLWNNSGTELLAKTTNAHHQQVAVTSFEPLATGGWHYDSTAVHQVTGGYTGRYAYQLDGTAPVTRGQMPVGDYEVTYWVQGTPPILTIQNGSLLMGGTQLVAMSPNGWSQYRTRLHFTTTGQVILSGVTGKLDELRLHPVGAQLINYNYDSFGNVTSQTGPDGRTQTYEYDGLGRLLRTRDEQGRILGQQQYHYAGQ